MEQSQFQELKESGVIGMNFERVILALIAVVAIIVVPVTSPELAANVGDAFAVPLQFITTLLSGIAEQLMQFEGDLYTWLIGAGVSAPLTFAVVAMLKKSKYLAKKKSQHMALVVATLIYGAMMVAQDAGQIVAFENGVQVAVLVLSMFAGVGASQYGASSIHDKFVDSPLAFAYKRAKS